MHLTPFLGEQVLYEEFRLDEPWNSPHNQRLINNMPAVYAPASGLQEPGKTTLQTVTGPNAAFEGGLGCRIRDITDGSTTTVMLVETEDAHAVVWTQPGDYEYSAIDPSHGLRQHGDEEIFVLFCSGEIGRVPLKEGTRGLVKMFTRSGGEAY